MAVNKTLPCSAYRVYAPDELTVARSLSTVYLLVGLTFTMLTLAVFCDIPQLNVGLLFLARSDETTNDPEKVRLNQPACPHTQYTQQRVHVRTRLDSPSPEEVTPVHARP